MLKLAALDEGRLSGPACAAFAAACAERGLSVVDEVEEVDVLLFEHVLELCWLRALGEDVSLDEARHAHYAAAESLNGGQYDLGGCERAALGAILYAHEAAFGEDPARGARRAALKLLDAAQNAVRNDDRSKEEESAWIIAALTLAESPNFVVRRDAFDAVPPSPARWPFRFTHRFDPQRGLSIESIPAKRAPGLLRQRAERAARVAEHRARAPVPPWREPSGIPERLRVRRIAQGPSSREGKLITPGHEYVGLFSGEELVFAPPSAVALGMSPDERALFSWRVEKREGHSGVGRGDYRWTLERYSWPDRTLEWQHVVADQKTIDWCWPDDLTVPADAGGRLISLRARSEDQQAWIHVVEEPDGHTRATRDRDEARDWITASSPRWASNTSPEGGTTEATLVQRIETIYAQYPHHILPYIGAAYSDPRADDLRVLALGIKAYVSARDWPPRPDWFRSWIESRRYRYQKRLASEVQVLADALTDSTMFAGKTYDAARCLYATNAVKVYVPEERGKQAAGLTEADFAPHVEQWHEELRALDDAGAMPHVIAVFGRVCWPYAWQAFHPKLHGERQGVVDFEPITRDAPHRINRVVVHRGSRHELLLVGLRHPSRGARTGTARWLASTNALRDTIGSPSHHRRASIAHDSADHGSRHGA